MKKPRLPITTYNAGLIQAQAYRALSSFMSTALRVNALSMPEWAVLGLLRDRGAVRQADLAERMAVKRPVITKMIQSLERKGWLDIVADPLDSRAIRVSLRDDAAKTVDAIEYRLREEMRHFLADVSLLELFSYLKTLRKIAAKV